MNQVKIDWQRLDQTPTDELAKSVFDILQFLANAVQYGANDDPDILESVPRLIDLIADHPSELSSFREVVSTLARSTGLWNYIDKEFCDTTDRLVAETVTANQLDGIVLHREQVNALNALLNGKNLILSAPTSFGKSLLVDALLATKNYHRVAIILPTIALLDEFRKRIRKRFGSYFKIIMHASDVVTENPTVFLGTQERLINRNDIGKLDLTVVDEFYKLDPSRRDERSVTLNAAVYKLLAHSKQFFFLGPNIDAVKATGEVRWNFEFLKTRFSTVAVDTLDLRDVHDKREYLTDAIGDDANWPALVFVSSPDRANQLAIDISDEMAVSDDSSEFAIWLQNNVGTKNFLSRSVEMGFGVHHGRVPRAIASRMVSLFNRGDLPVLICTSTLIEGVNTAAKTVMIFDKTIQRRNYDFFTFSNIKGRAGRLGQHHVGKVILFNEIPIAEELEIEPTLFSDEGNYPDEYIVHIEENERKTRSIERFKYIKETLNLETEELRMASSIGFEKAIHLKKVIHDSIETDSLLIWSGSPRYAEIMAVVEAICKVHPVSSFGAWTTKQLTYYLDQLRRTKSLKQFLIKMDENFRGEPHEGDNIFKFLRACEYGLAQYFAVADIFVKQINPQTDYSFFFGAMSSWFKPEILKELDEEGIPVQISERFYQYGDDRLSLVERITRHTSQHDQLMSDFERDWLLESLAGLD